MEHENAKVIEDAKHEAREDSIVARNSSRTRILFDTMSYVISNLSVPV